jgi:two-component system, NarL family, nitrate/nitrite response regulator NarL
MLWLDSRPTAGDKTRHLVNQENRRKGPEASLTRYTVLLVDDHVLVRESIARMLEGAPLIAQVLHCGGCTEALALLETHDVQLILLDFDLGAESGTQLLRMMREALSEVPVLVLTAGVSEYSLTELVRMGVRGVVEKERPLEELLESMETVLKGSMVFDPKYVKQAVLALQEPAKAAARELSEQEKAVLRYLVNGYSNKEAGEAMGITESAVKATLQRLFEKTGTRKQSMLVRFALEHYHGKI